MRNLINNNLYYSNNISKLKTSIDEMFDKYKVPKISEHNIYSIVSPVAKYSIAKEIYASSYSQVVDEEFDSIIILSPLHRMSFRGIALTDFETFDTPFGPIAVDQEANKILQNFNEQFIFVNDDYHQQEESIEVQLPIIKTIFNNKTKIIPIILGETNTRFTIMLSKAISKLFEKSNKKFLIVIATNLSYGLEYEKSTAMDKKFSNILSEKNTDNFSQQLSMGAISAFGGGGIVTVMRLSEQYPNHRVSTLKYLNSASVTDDKNKTEGYASIVFWNK